MLAIRWDVLIVAGVVALLVGYLVVQLLFRFNGSRLLEAVRVARSSSRDERSVYDLTAESRRQDDERHSSKWRKVL
jgi:hypothetical protein